MMAPFSLIISAFLLPAGALSLVLPEILFISKSQIVDPGGEARLTCHFKGLEGHDFGWVKSSEAGKVDMVSKNRSIMMDQSKYSLINEDSFGRIGETIRLYSLVIRNVSPSDNGTYECLVYINQSFILRNRTTLLVVPSVLRRERVLVGDKARLECVSPRFMFAEVVWTRYGKAILPEGSVVGNGNLVITSAESEDSGLYVCHAEFLLDDQALAATRSVMLSVVHPLEVKVRNDKLIRPEGYDANLACLIETVSSSVSVTWTKDNQPLTEDPRHRTQLFETKWESGSFDKSLKVAELVMRNINSDDYGLYACNIENEFGIQAKTIYLAQYL